MSGGIYTLSGAGDYSNNQNRENGYAAYHDRSGDGQIQARVTSESGFMGTDTSVGIFIRNGSSSGADGAMLWLENPGGTRYIYADRTNGGNISEHQNASCSIPYWLRLQNSGGIITPALSPDGSVWTTLQSYDLSSDLGSGNLSYGLMVWSGNSSQPTTVVFDEVCLSSITPIPSATRTPTRTPTPANPTPTWTPTATPAATVTSSPTPPPGVRIWPNPFTPAFPPNDRTRFLLSQGHGPGRVLIADLKRRLVRSFDFSAGADVFWDGRDNSGNMVESGVYLFLIEADGAVSRGTITVMR